MARGLSPGETLVLASHNEGKLREIVELIAPYGVTVADAASLGLPEPDETEPDFAGNARLKAIVAARAAQMPALADDSGFCVAALGGAPGVVSARWAGPQRDFGIAMARVNSELGDAADRRAWFVSVLCIAWPDAYTATFFGRVDGTVVWPPRGTRGFGYDPIFVHAGRSETYGEMDPAEKGRISHRARAFAQLLAACIA
ncbi:MAG TPA: RdgB/HAM1 family non-canonical purine NTP pyrophosphatase [Acetobacteraceae bacterium]|jgi:XTP/dITP diphosphohydrolase|nr:RdgB/HAM1 family non-canonical purine NTP pyrophosphatase [Acetobacteraceae bacterium]